MINVDGSYGLGSGQLVRYALSFSALSRKPIHITDIRSSRPSPGQRNRRGASTRLPILCSC